MKYILTSVGLFAIFYLMTAFINLSFDPHKWDMNTREILAVGGGFLSIGASIIGCAWHDINNEIKQQ